MSTEDIIAAIKENVIQGRKTADDEGIDETLSGTPGVMELIQSALDSKIPLETIIAQGLTSGMTIVGEKFAAKEYFIPDMLASAEAVGAAMELLKPLLEASKIETKGHFVIATVKGDIHDIGKNIVAILLRGAGYAVTDLGVDVPKEQIVSIVREEKPNYLGLSALLTTTMAEMGEVVKALKESGLRDKVKILIGGAAVCDNDTEEIGADAYCTDGFHAIKVLDAFNKVSV